VILAVSFGIAIHGFWIPAIPAGMTCLKLLMYNDEHSAKERKSRTAFSLSNKNTTGGAQNDN
jgi:hypothetical protein